MFLNLISLIASATRTAPEDLEVKDPQDLTSVPTKDLITMYNRAVPSSPVKKFATAAIARERTFKMLEGGLRADKDVEEVQDTNDPGWNLGATDPAPAVAATATQDSTTEEEGTVAATATKAKGKGTSATRKASAAKKGAATDGVRGRQSNYAGKFLYKVGDKNPCRDGGLRAKSWDLIRDGMTYEQFVEKGGRAQELAFNVRQGRVKVKNTKDGK